MATAPRATDRSRTVQISRQARRLVVGLVGAMLLGLLIPDRGTASELSADLAARRARVMARMNPGSLLVLWSAPQRRYSLDINYEYRQDSNLYYLTGITQPDTVLVLMPGNRSHREILFIKDGDPVREQWEGRRLTHDEAAEQSGIATIRATQEVDGFIDALLARRGTAGVDVQESAAFLTALDAGRASILLAFDAPEDTDATPPSNADVHGSSVVPPARSEDVADHGPAGRLAAKARITTPPVAVVDALTILADLRTIKTPFERRLLTRSLKISSDAQMAGMRAARAGAHEYTIKAAIEGFQRAAGAISWSYPSIVASGPNATIVHYPGSHRQLASGELVLVDAAANVDYMSGDITRTYPVGGLFSAEQRILYQLVLDAQDAGIAVARTGGSLAAIHDRTAEVLRAGLLKLGLITSAEDSQYMMWFMHGATHYIGIDVHDVGDRTAPLQPGMAFVIEPGLYIDPSTLTRLPDSPNNRALIARITPAVEKFAGLGVRIEDSFLLDDNGLVQLSRSVPRTIADIEAFMHATPAATPPSRPERARPSSPRRSPTATRDNATRDKE